MASVLALFQLHALDNNALIELEAALKHGLLNSDLQSVVVDLRLLNFGEQIHEKVIKESDILEDELGQVHITDSLEHNLYLVLVRLLALNVTTSKNARLDGTSGEIIEVLPRELPLHEIIDSADLFGELFVLLEALRHQDVLGDGIEIGHHHGNWTEQTGQVIRQLRPTSIARVHCDEETSVVFGIETSSITYIDS